MSVLSYLEKLEKDLRLSQSEKDSIETSISTLKTRLNNYFGDDISEILIFGSYKRNTNLCRKADESSDVDVMVVFKDFGYKPQTYIDRLKRFMENKYFSSEIYQSSPCAILELHHIKFELTPAIWCFDKTYKIPDNSYLEWQYTKPFELDELARVNSHLRYKHITRLVKYWNCLNYKYYASFELEKLVLNTRLFCDTNNLKQSLFQVLKNISYSYSTPQYVKNYIDKTKSIIQYIEENENDYPFTCEDKIKTLFKELN